MTINSAQWSSPVARQAHNLEVVRSNRTCATSYAYPVDAHKRLGFIQPEDENGKNCHNTRHGDALYRGYFPSGVGWHTHGSACRLGGWPLFQRNDPRNPWSDRNSQHFDVAVRGVHGVCRRVSQDESNCRDQKGKIGTTISKNPRRLDSVRYTLSCSSGATNYGGCHVNTLASARTKTTNRTFIAQARPSRSGGSPAISFWGSLWPPIQSRMEEHRNTPTTYAVVWQHCRRNSMQMSAGFAMDSENTNSDSRLAVEAGHSCRSGAAQCVMGPALCKAATRRQCRYATKCWSPQKNKTNTQRGVWYGSQGPQRIVIGRSLAEFSSRFVSIRRPTSTAGLAIQGRPATAKTLAQSASKSEADGEVQDRCESTSPPLLQGAA